MMLFEEIKKFNPYHGADGRFTTAGGATSFTYKPGASKAHDDAIQREKERNPFDPFDALMGAATGELPGWYYSAPEKLPKKKTPTSKLDSNGIPTGQAKGKNIVNEDWMPENKLYENGSEKSVTDMVAEAQGFKGKPAVVSRAEFDEAVKRSGVIAYRTINSGDDVVSGNGMSAKQFAEKLLYGEPYEVALNGRGKQSFGGGIYTAVTKKAPAGSRPPQNEIDCAWEDSTTYGHDEERSAVVSITLSPTAKIGDYDQVNKEFFYGNPNEIIQKYGMDVGAYAAASGFDGLRKEFDDDADYMMIYNRSALIICDDITNVNGDTLES